MVFATAPPQPASKDFASTRAFVPGGPEPSRKGLGNLIPLTVIERSIKTPQASNCGLLKFGNWSVWIEILIDDFIRHERFIKDGDYVRKVKVNGDPFWSQAPAG